MYKATINDKAKIVNILKKSFIKDPHTNWYVTGHVNGIKNDRKYEIFLEYLFYKALFHGEISVSDNDEGCALWVKYDKPHSPLRMLRASAKILITFGMKHTLNVIKLQKTIERKQKAKPFLHLLFLGVDPLHQKKGISSSLLNPILEDAINENFTVLLETANPHNISIYEKKGFLIYEKWNVSYAEDLEITFMQFNELKN